MWPPYKYHSSAQQQQLYCPGLVTIDCSTATPVIWDGTAFNGQCPLNGIAYQDATTANIGEATSCGEIGVTITNVVFTTNVGVTTTVVESTLSFNAQSSFNGSIVRCRSGSNPNLNVELLIPGEYIPRAATPQGIISTVHMHVV